MGLSFYDGRPMYYFSLGRPASGEDYPLYLSAERLRTGDDISELPNYNSQYGYVIIQGKTSKDFIIYGYDDNGHLEYLSFVDNPDKASWMQKALTLYGPGALAQASTGDLGLNVADELFAMAKDIFGEFFPFFAGIFALAAGSKYFEHLAKTGVKKSRQTPVVGSKLKTKSREVDVLDYVDLPNDNPYRLRTPRELREERIRENREILSAQANMSEKDAVRAAYIDGSFWGREFSDDVKESNRQLLESFDAMDEFTRSLLIQRFEEMSFFQEVSVLKSYRYDAYGVGEYSGANPFVNGSFDDNADDAFDSWFGAPWDEENSEV
ncbi:MAG: hypothetical protein J6K25_06955 [Thermoguttaceae bacterium]|nr:hypothetical protein [Thermoguttaceae bacterium]